jgi:hypothetical protein
MQTKLTNTAYEATTFDTARANVLLRNYQQSHSSSHEVSITPSVRGNYLVRLQALNPKEIPFFLWVQEVQS